MNALLDDYIKQIGNIWDNKSNPDTVNQRIHWWDSPKLIRHMNYLICGEELDGWNTATIKELKKIRNRYELAVSVGCGSGGKEMQLLEQGIVERFICFELSEERIKIGTRNAKIRGLDDRIQFFYGDFFCSNWVNKKYDLVFWDNSLHHMPDTYEAVKVSRNILKDDGVLFCNEYIGESRFQWSDEKLAYVNQIRDDLDESLFHVGDEIFPRHRKRPTIERMMQSDPSEAADSANILPAIKRYFKEPRITMLGGTVHLLILDRMIQNIPENSELLEQLIAADDEAIKKGMSMYAFILTQK